MSSDRRRFLKGSLAVGAAGATSPLVAAQRGAKASPATVAQQPSAARVQAEAGAVEQGPGIRPATHGSEMPAHVDNPGSDFMVDVIKAAGIRYIAATPGSTFRGIHESIVNYGGNSKPEFIVCVHEEISAAMAHGYAKVAGEPMACLVHSNIGLQHASMAIYNAFCDRSPMMILTGNALDATKRRPGVEWVHSSHDVGAMVRDFVKWDDVPISLPHFAESFMRAYEISITPPYLPVMIVIDAELQEVPAADREALSIPKRAAVSPSSGSTEAVDRAAAMLVAAENPLIIADRAARSQEGVDLLVSLAEALNAPVVDRGGRMNMPTTHFLNQTSRQSRLVVGADVILGLEVTDIWGIVNTVPDLVERISKRLVGSETKVIAVSANYAFMKSNVQDIQRYLPADLTIAADAQACLPQLIAAVKRLTTPARRQVIKAREPALREAYAQMRQDDADAAAKAWDASPISTARLSMELWDQIRDLDWGLVSSTAFASFWPQRLWDITKHYQFIGDAGGYGMGYGAPSAAGAALAHRDAGRIAVAIQTDGDLMVLPGTLWTLAHHNIPLLSVMHNNRAWHQETMHLQRMTSRRNRGPGRWTVGTVINDPTIDYAMMAKSMGVWAEGPISDPELLKPALARALAVVKSGKPALLDVVTQPR